MTITSAIYCKECKNTIGTKVEKFIPCVYWIRMSGEQPKEDGEILFIAKDGITIERVGTVLPKMKIVLLEHTDIKFDDIIYWLPIPKRPT
jgi:hypothetical protein